MASFQASDVLKKGYIDKKGNKIKVGGWKRRFVVLLKTQKILYYTADTLDELKGEIDISESNLSSSYANKGDCVKSVVSVNYGFNIECSERTWEFKCDSFKLRDEWVIAVKKCILKTWDKEDSTTKSKQDANMDPLSPTGLEFDGIIPQIEEVPMKHALDYHMTLCNVAEMLAKTNSNLAKLIATMGDSKNDSKQGATSPRATTTTKASDKENIENLKGILHEYNSIGKVLTPYLAYDEKSDEMDKTEFSNQFNGAENRSANMSISMGAFKNLTEFDALLNEIEVETNQAEINDSNINEKYRSLPQSTKAFINKPFGSGSKHVITAPLETRMQLWNEFCTKCGNTWGERDYCSPIDPMGDTNKTLNKNEVTQMVALWNDYVNFRICFFDNELKTTLLKSLDISSSSSSSDNDGNKNDSSDGTINRTKTNSNEMKVIQVLLKSLKYRRTQIGVYPSNCYRKTFEEYKKIATCVHDKNNELTNGLRYFYLWNGISIMFREGVSWNTSFDKCIKPVDLIRLETAFYDHFIEQLLYTGIFGLINEDKEAKLKQISEKFSKNALAKLIKYLLQNISMFYYFSLKYFVINRLAFVIFHDLFICGKEKSQVKPLFPNLKQLFQILWNYGVYCACYPWITYDSNNKESMSNASIDESFYISQYWLLRDKCFNDLPIGKLQDFNVIDDPGKPNNSSLEGSGASLLHRATFNKMEHYCNVLLKDGFNSQLICHFAKKQSSPTTIAKQKMYSKILSSFERTLNGGAGDSKENESKNEDSADGAASLALAGNQGGANAQDFNQLLCFGKYFLTMIGCNVDSGDEEKGNELYKKFEEFSGVTGVRSSESVDTGMKSMTLICEKTIELLNKKLPINDTLLLLSYQFCKYTSNDKLLDTLIQALESASAESVNEELVNKATMARDYHWFKTFLSDSNIWLVRRSRNNDSGKDGNKQSEILYKFLDEMADDAKEKQQEYIWANVSKEEENDAAIWSVMLQFEDYQSDKYASPLRQDRIKNGNVAQMSYHELFLMSTKIEDSSKFNIVSSYDNNIYLTQCLASAHSMNSQFQKDVKDVFISINKNCTFEATAVKTYDECARIINIQKEYTPNEFPRGASILNFCSTIITFNTVKEMYSGLNQFMGKVNSGDCGCVIDIVKIENGFNKILDWKSAKDSEYCDITLNVIIHDKLSNTSMIGEINLVLTWLLKASIMGMKLTEIKRKTPLMIQHANLMYNIHNNNDRYKSKLAIMMGNGDNENVGNELLLSSNRIFSLIDQDNGNVPLLYHCGKNFDENPKLFDLFFNSLMYYNNVMLKDKDGAFLKKYLNFNNCQNLVGPTEFFGFNVAKNDKEQHEPKWRCIEAIMGNDHFDGLKPSAFQDFKGLILHWCMNNCFDYFSLIVEHCDKNKEIIIHGINNKNHPLISLLTTQHCNEEWLNLLFKASENVNARISLQVLQYAVKEFGKRYKNEKFKQIIETYMKKHFPSK